MSIIIPKPNKPSYYDTPKAFHPIILLNTLGKLIEKAISSRLQIHTIASNFIHPSQLEGIKQCLTMDARIFLTYLIHMAWMKSLHTSTLAFDIVQFFPSLNHYLLSMILVKITESKLSFFLFSYSHFHFLLIYFHFSIFNLGLGLVITSLSHKSYDAWKDVEGFRRSDII